MANLLNFIFVFVPVEICKCMLNILISVGLAQWTICCHPNDHLEWDDNIRHICLWFINSLWAGCFVLNMSSEIQRFGCHSHVLPHTPITGAYYNRENRPLKLVVWKDLQNKTCSFNLSEEGKQDGSRRKTVSPGAPRSRTSKTTAPRGRSAYRWLPYVERCMPAWLPMVWVQQRHPIKVENGGNFYLHNTDSIFCPLSQEQARLIPIIMERKLLIIHLESLPALFHVRSPLTNEQFLVQADNWISLFVRRIVNFHVCFVLIFLLTWLLCPLWLSRLIPEFASVYLFFYFKPLKKKKNLKWSECMHLAGIYSSMLCQTRVLWCYPVHLLREGRSDNGAESKRRGLMS